LVFLSTTVYGPSRPQAVLLVEIDVNNIFVLFMFLNFYLLLEIRGVQVMAT
jgi:hypothetical protein